MNYYFRGHIINNRIWVPKNLHKELRNNFSRFTVKHKKNNITFISKLNKDGRLVVPKKNKIKNRNIVIYYKILENSIRPKRILNKSRIDLLSVVPEKTMSGFDILALPNGNSIFLWYFASRGRPKSIILNRYLKPEFCRLLGYYRSEGGKPKLSKRRGREFSFTNKSVEMIYDFIQLYKNFSDKEKLKATIRYNTSSYKKIYRLKKQLVDFGINPESINSGKYENVKDFTIRIYVTSSIISETIDNAENKLRKYMLILKNKEFLIEYLRGVIAGDGSFYVWTDKKGSNHSRLQIFEPNRLALEDIKTLLEILQIKGVISKSKKSQMYIYTAYLNWNNLLYAYEKNLIPFKNEKIKYIIRKHKRFRSMKHLLVLPRRFTTSEFTKLTNRSYVYSTTWLNDREKEGLIIRVGKESNQNVWRLENSSIRLISILQNVENNNFLSSL